MPTRIECVGNINVVVAESADEVLQLAAKGGYIKVSVAGPVQNQPIYVNSAQIVTIRT